MAGATMVVGCKLPHGLVLRMQIKHVQPVNVGGAVHNVELWGFDTAADAESYTLKGFARPAAQVPDAKIVGAHRAMDGGTIGGYAISYIPKDFWDKWAAQNKDFPPLRNGSIVAWEKQDSVEGHARERIDVMSGFEPINPNKLPRGIEPAKVS